VMLPIGESQNQKFIAEVMKNPICLGGAKFRGGEFTGEVDSVYLGAFNRQKIKVDYWFDDNGKISEDSELNFRIRQSGGRVVVDSSIIVEYFPRDGIKSFLRLCFNYGVGRGLFVLKHRTFSAFRQIVPPVFFLVILILLVAGFFNSIYFSLCFGLIFCYLFSLTLIASASVKSILEIFKFVAAISGCHFFWSLGLVFSPLYKKN
jgi:succinoglycan biosynthesis protein ExoA